MADQKPSVGRIVHYQFTESDTAKINRRRESFEDQRKADLINWNDGAQAHVGNRAHEGATVPLLIVVVNEDSTINGQAFLDGNDTLWVTSAAEGTGTGCWSWPPRV